MMRSAAVLVIAAAGAEAFTAPSAFMGAGVAQRVSPRSPLSAPAPAVRSGQVGRTKADQASAGGGWGRQGGVADGPLHAESIQTFTRDP